MKVLPRRECSQTMSRISEVVLGDELLPLEGERHVARCLKCQAEIAQFRTIDRGFAALRGEVVTAPADLVKRVMHGLDRAPVPWFRRPVPVSVSAASAVAVTATVILALRRRQATA